jgi:ADP-ribosylation factor-binding protein GGA
MAARDRFGAFAVLGLSPLQRAIRTSLSACLSVTYHCLTWPGNACDLQNYEPNLALNLEVADLINTKKGNA